MWVRGKERAREKKKGGHGETVAPGEGREGVEEKENKKEERKERVRYAKMEGDEDIKKKKKGKKGGYGRAVASGRGQREGEKT